MNRVMGIDQSKSQTGICRADCMLMNGNPNYDTEKFKVQALGTVATVAKWSDELSSHLDSPCSPSLVAYELPVIVQLNNMVLYQLSGVLIHMCNQRRIPVIGIHNQTLKRWAGCGQGEKPMAYGLALTGMSKLTSDECDAAVLCEIAYYVANQETDPGTDIKREIVRKLRMTEEEKADAVSRAKFTKAAAIVATNEARQQKILLAAVRAEIRAEKRQEAQRKRDEKVAKNIEPVNYFDNDGNLREWTPMV